MSWRFFHHESKTDSQERQQPTSDKLPQSIEAKHGNDISAPATDSNLNQANATSRLSELTWKDIKHLRKEFAVMEKTAAIYMSKTHCEGEFDLQFLTFNGEVIVHPHYQREGFLQPGNGWVNVILQDFKKRHLAINDLLAKEMQDLRIPEELRNQLRQKVGLYAREFIELEKCSQPSAKGAFDSVSIYRQALRSGHYLYECEMLEKQILKDKSLKTKFTAPKILTGDAH